MAFADPKRMQEYNESYKRENYDRIKLLLRKGHRELVKQAAADAGESLNVYVKEAIAARLAADGHFVPPDF